jgi:hypothetical protein
MCRLHSNRSCRKPQASIPKVQEAPIIQIPNGTGAALHSLLMFEISLELGYWNLEFHFRHLVTEVPDPGEDHCHITIVRGGDDLLVAH